jgi:cysteine desulfurase/selenocysteine lyase
MGAASGIRVRFVSRPPFSSGMDTPQSLDIAAIRRHFVFPGAGRVVTNNAASTQPPRALLELFHTLALEYDNVHRGQSSASQATTRRFEAAYDDIAAFVHAPGRENVVVTRNTTEAHNVVLHALLPEFRDGDNVVTTLMEHNSNYVPWHALAREILPRFGRRVGLRLARFDPATGELDLDHLASLVDARTKLVCCTGASNFLGTKPPLDSVRAIARAGGYRHSGGEEGAYLLVDGAQLVPGTAVDFQALGADFLSFSFHKMLAPFGAGALVARRALLERLPPFLYGGDMIAEGQVFPDRVAYGPLPWKYAAGTPNILGTIAAAHALRTLLDLALSPRRALYAGSARPIEHADVRTAMRRVGAWTGALTARALERLEALPGLAIYGPRNAARRSSLVAFNVAGRDPMALAAALNEAGVESRAGCHCATLAHHALHLTPPASCRLSFYLYNTPHDVDTAVDALEAAVAGAPRRRRAWLPRWRERARAWLPQGA